VNFSERERTDTTKRKKKKRKKPKSQKKDGKMGGCLEEGGRGY